MGRKSIQRNGQAEREPSESAPCSVNQSRLHKVKGLASAVIATLKRIQWKHDDWNIWIVDVGEWIGFRPANKLKMVDCDKLRHQRGHQQ